MGPVYHSQIEALRGESKPSLVPAVWLQNSNAEVGTWAGPPESPSQAVGWWGGTAANRAVYFGGSDAFVGLEMEYTQQPDFGGSGQMALQYWNGSSWLPTQMMMGQAHVVDDAARTSGASPGASLGVGVFRVRFGEVQGWAPKSLNGGPALFWMRMLLTQAIVADAQVRVGTLRLVARGASGDYYGAECPLRPLPISRAVISGAAALVNGSVVIGSGGNAFTAVLAASTLAAGAGDSVVLLIPIPEGVNSAFPIQIALHIIPTTDGTLPMEYTPFVLLPGQATAQALAGTPVTRNYTISSQSGKITVVTELLQVPGMFPGGYLAVRARRLATGDTAGSAVFWDARVQARFLR